MQATSAPVLTVTLPYPPSANRYWRHCVINGRVSVYLSGEAKKYKRDIAVIGLSLGCKPLEGRVRFTAKVFRPRKSGDLMNREKVLCDALQQVAYIDDSQITEAHFFLFDDRENPRVEVHVEALETE